MARQHTLRQHTARRPVPRGPGSDQAGPDQPPTPARGVSVVLDLPDASVADLVDVADTLHALALDLAPGARASTAVHVGPGVGRLTP